MIFIQSDEYTPPTPEVASEVTGSVDAPVFIESEPYNNPAAVVQEADDWEGEDKKVSKNGITYIRSDQFVAPETEAPKVQAAEQQNDAPVFIQSDAYVAPSPAAESAKATDYEDTAVFISSEPFIPPPASPQPAAPQDVKEEVYFVESEPFVPPEPEPEASSAPQGSVEGVVWITPEGAKPKAAKAKLKRKASPASPTNTNTTKPKSSSTTTSSSSTSSSSTTSSSKKSGSSKSGRSKRVREPDSNTNALLIGVAVAVAGLAWFLLSRPKANGASKN